MFKKIIQRIRLRILARQLRRPSGKRGQKVGLMMNKANAFLYDFTLGIMRPQEGEKLLEIGFGNGLFFDKVFSTAKDLQVYGLDHAATMYDLASENNRRAIEEGRLKLRLGNSDKMPFPDHYFDRIFCLNVIYFWDHPQPHLLEIRRVLKPGGRFYATVRTRESMQRMPFTKYGFNDYDADKWNALLTETGLQFGGEYPVDEPPIDPARSGFDYKQQPVQSVCLVAEKI